MRAFRARLTRGFSWHDNRRHHESGRKVRVNIDLQDDFSINQSLGLWLVETAQKLDPETASYELDVLTLETRFPLPETPGSPLCVAKSAQGQMIEIALKGGQVGGDDYFVKLRDGLK